jgi:hypothetical protein
VKPRSSKPRRHYPVVAVDGWLNVLTEDGQAFTFAEFLAVLPEWPPTLFVTFNSSGELTLRIHNHFKDHATWATNWNCRIVKDEDRPGREKAFVTFFGWKSERKHDTNRYHHITDATTFHARSLDEMCPPLDGEPPIKTLLRWGVAVRDFCQANNWEVRATQGSTVSQALTDTRFYPNPRRKVTKHINARARKYLPGCYWSLEVTADKVWHNAIYIDQRRAHHYHAEHTPLPDANELWAYGRFLDLDRIVYGHIPDDFYGLCCVDMERPARPYLFDWIHPSENLTKYFVWSSELPQLFDMGYRVTGVRAMWGSMQRDTGIPLYSQWAQQQLDEHSNDTWIKPLLLSLYGILACCPRIPHAWYAKARRGDIEEIVIGSQRAVGRQVEGKRQIESRTANVIHRGLIEAATRAETVAMANLLNSAAIGVLHIYVDGIIAEDRPVGILPAPWRLDRYLTDYRGHNDTWFSSNEINRMPGRPGIRPHVRMQQRLEQENRYNARTNAK